MKLISMTDFVLETKNNSITQTEKYNVIEWQKKCEAFNKIITYASFLKQPLELGMFIVCDEDGNVLDKPKKYDNWTNFDYSGTDIGFEDEKLCRQYQKAKEKVFFEGFKSTGRFKVSSGFEDFSFLKYNNGNTQVYVKDYTKEELNESLCYTIEDLIKYKLTLTENALKQLEII
jgi:hypothetical protein